MWQTHTSKESFYVFRQVFAEKTETNIGSSLIFFLSVYDGFRYGYSTWKKNTTFNFPMKPNLIPKYFEFCDSLEGILQMIQKQNMEVWFEMKTHIHQ